MLKVSIPEVYFVLCVGEKYVKEHFPSEVISSYKERYFVDTKELVLANEANDKFETIYLSGMKKDASDEEPSISDMKKMLISFTDKLNCQHNCVNYYESLDNDHECDYESLDDDHERDAISKILQIYINQKVKNFDDIKTLIIWGLDLRKPILEELLSKCVNLRTISLEDNIGCSCCTTSLYLTCSNMFDKMMNISENFKLHYAVLEEPPPKYISEQPSKLKRLVLSEVRRYRGEYGGIGSTDDSYGVNKFYDFRGYIAEIPRYHPNLTHLYINMIHFGLDGRLFFELARNCKLLQVLCLNTSNWAEHADKEEEDKELEALLNNKENCLNEGLKFLIFSENSILQSIQLYGGLWSRIRVNVLQLNDSNLNFVNPHLKKIEIESYVSERNFDKDGIRLKMKFGYGPCNEPFKALSEGIDDDDETFNMLGLNKKETNWYFPNLIHYSRIYSLVKESKDNAQMSQDLNYGFGDKHFAHPEEWLKWDL